MKDFIEIAGGDAVLVEHYKELLTRTSRFSDEDHPFKYEDFPGDVPYPKWNGHGPEPTEYVEDFMHAIDQGLYEEIPWSKAIHEQISNRLMEAMQNVTGKGRPKSEIARRIGCDSSTLSGYVNSPETMPRNVALAVSLALKASPEWIRTGNDMSVFSVSRESTPNMLSIDDLGVVARRLNYENRKALTRVAIALDQSQSVTKVLEKHRRSIAIDGDRPTRPELRSMKSRVEEAEGLRYAERFLERYSDAEICF